MEDNKRVKLTDEYDVVKSGMGFNIEFTSSVIFEKKVRGEMRECQEKTTKYYGTLYQALHGFVHDYAERYSNSVEEMVRVSQEAMDVLDDAKEKISEEWKVVKVVRGS